MNPRGGVGRHIFSESVVLMGDEVRYNTQRPRERGIHIMATLLTLLQRSLCSLHGHDQLMEFQSDRILLRCSSCGHQTQGWEVARRTMTREFAESRDSDRIARPVPQFSTGHQQVA
jgi:hypothetical protein